MILMMKVMMMMARPQFGTDLWMDLMPTRRISAMEPKKPKLMIFLASWPKALRSSSSFGPMNARLGPV